MRIRIGILIFVLASLTATAGTVTLSGLGNGQGWNDGSYYTGYVTLGFDDTSYSGLCIDALHETRGDSWEALYIPLTDTATVTNVMLAYFGTSDSTVYLPKLYLDMAGYTMLSTIGTDKVSNDDIQHSVWAQFDPGRYTDTGILSTFANDNPPLDPSMFALIVDAGYASGSDLEQVFLVEQPSSHHLVIVPTPEPASGVTLSAAMMIMAMLGILHRKRRTLRPALAKSAR